jgi:hypothetical protein
MASTPGQNVARLQKAGFSIKPLPQEYEEVIEDLSGEEVELLVGMKERLDEADARTPPGVFYTEYFRVPL